MPMARAPIPLRREQGNQPFRVSDPRSAAKRGQTVPYDVNGAPNGARLADGDYGDIVVSGSGATFSFDSAVVTTFARTILDDVDATAARTTLGLDTAAGLAFTPTGTIAATNVQDAIAEVAAEASAATAASGTFELDDGNAAGGGSFNLDDGAA